MSDHDIAAKAAVSKFLREVIGEDLTREGLRETPDRVAKAWHDNWGAGYRKQPEDVLKTFQDGSEGYDGIVLVSNIPVWSTCEHHCAMFWGHAHIGYIPDKRIVGLSKFARVVDVFARRLQVQERLTKQICEALHKCLAPRGVGVVLECRHSCMESRGVRARGTITTTCSLDGVIREPAARAEFFSLVTNASNTKNGI